MKHGETLAKAKTIIDNGPPLSVGDLALHLGMTYSGARRVAEALSASGQIVRTKQVGGMVIYEGLVANRARAIQELAADPSAFFARFYPQAPTKSLWTRFLEWMRK